MKTGAMGIAGVLCAALALAVSPALAAKRRLARHEYSAGSYLGQVSQSVPQAYSGTIGFSIRSGKLSNLHFKVTMACGTLMAQVASPPSSLRVKIARDGTFSYSRTVGGTHVELRGRVHGGRVAGRFFESFHMSALDLCTMYRPAAFGAGV